MKRFIFMNVIKFGRMKKRFTLMFFVLYVFLVFNVLGYDYTYYSDDGEYNSTHNNCSYMGCSYVFDEVICEIINTYYFYSNSTPVFDYTNQICYYRGICENDIYKEYRVNNKTNITSVKGFVEDLNQQNVRIYISYDATNDDFQESSFTINLSVNSKPECTFSKQLLSSTGVAYFDVPKSCFNLEINSGKVEYSATINVTIKEGGIDPCGRSLEITESYSLSVNLGNQKISLYDIYGTKDPYYFSLWAAGVDGICPGGCDGCDYFTFHIIDKYNIQFCYGDTVGWLCWWGCYEVGRPRGSKTMNISSLASSFSWLNDYLSHPYLCYDETFDETQYPSSCYYVNKKVYQEDPSQVGWSFKDSRYDNSCCSEKGGVFINKTLVVEGGGQLVIGGGSDHFCCRPGGSSWSSHNGTKSGTILNNDKIVRCARCDGKGNITYYTLYGNNYYDSSSNKCYSGNIFCDPELIQNGTANSAPKQPEDITYTPIDSGKIRIYANISDPDGDEVILNVTTLTGAELCTSTSTKGGRVYCDFNLTDVCSPNDDNSFKSLSVFVLEKNQDSCGVKKKSSSSTHSILCDKLPPINSYAILSHNAYSASNTYYANAGKTFVIQVNSTDNHEMKELTFILADITCTNPYSCGNSIRIKYNGTNVVYDKTHGLFRIVKVEHNKSADSKTYSMNITLDILVYPTNAPINFTIVVNGTDWIGNSNLTKFNNEQSDPVLVIFNGGLTLSEENSFNITSFSTQLSESSNIIEVTSININSPLQSELLRKELHYSVSDLLRDGSCSEMYSSWIKSENTENVSISGLNNKCVRLRYFVQDVAGNIVFKEDSQVWKIR